MATIADVARLAGVSSSTVSHVLNGTRFVSSEKETAVRNAIAQTGYTPNTLARALARSSSNSVGIAVSMTSNPYFNDIIRAVESECTKFGMTVILADTHDDLERELEVVQALHQRRVDGIILSPCSDTRQSALAYLTDNDIPAVLVDRLASKTFDQVGVRNVEAAETLVDHLVSHGHSRIGFVPGQPGFVTTRERIDGFQRAVQRHRLDQALCVIGDGSSDVDTASAAITRMMTSDPRPTAIVSGNNMATIGVMRGLKTLALKVPDDIALVGFDDFEWADCFEPQLTAIAQPCDQIGRKAATLLLSRIENSENAAKTVRLHTQLIVRNSCGCKVHNS